VFLTKEGFVSSRNPWIVLSIALFALSSGCLDKLYVSGPEQVTSCDTTFKASISVTASRERPVPVTCTLEQVQGVEAAPASISLTVSSSTARTFEVKGKLEDPCVDGSFFVVCAGGNLEDSTGPVRVAGARVYSRLWPKRVRTKSNSDRFPYKTTDFHPTWHCCPLTPPGAHWHDIRLETITSRHVKNVQFNKEPEAALYGKLDTFEKWCDPSRVRIRGILEPGRSKGTLVAEVKPRNARLPTCYFETTIERKVE
jgi:hypothetical protein